VKRVLRKVVKKPSEKTRNKLKRGKTIKMKTILPK
jgi:hypothetical protein